MDAPSLRKAEELRLRHRRRLRAGIAASLALHLLLALALRGDLRPRSPYAAAGPRTGDDRAAPLGGGMEAINLRTTPAPALARIPRPPEPIPAPEATLEVEEVPEPPQPDLSGLAGPIGITPGPVPGAGLEGGTGQGDGGTSDEGSFRVVPPTPRGLILPPSDRPNRVRGKEVEVWVFVDAAGRVVADSTRILPSTGDKDYDERLRRQAAEWVFEPARSQGQPVAEWFRYIITL